MKPYEALVILKPELEGDALSIASKEIVETVKKHKGSVESVEEWGKKTLAYKIEKKPEGISYLIRFKSEPINIKEIKKEFSLNPNILREMITISPKQNLQQQPQAQDQASATNTQQAAQS